MPAEHPAADGGNPDTSNRAAGGLSDDELRDPEYLFSPEAASPGYGRTLVYLVTENQLDVPDRWLPLLERYAELQQRADRLTVALFAEDLDQASR